jgi:hypothetical protein
VSLGSYDPATGEYQTVATFDGPRFGSDVLVHGDHIYVAADDRVLRLDADDYSVEATAMVSGVRKLAIWYDQLLLTRGELGGLPHYFESRDAITLAPVAVLAPGDGLPYAAEDVLVEGDKAYLAVGNAFEWSDLQGRIGIVDLPTWTYAAEVDLGPEGRNPEHLMLHDGALFSFNNKDFSGSSVSRMPLGGLALDYTLDVATTSGCAASALANGRIYFLEYAQAELARFDIATGVVLDTLSGTPEVYGLIDDPINEVLYATTTDYVSSGELHVMSREGEVLSTVAVGVAPGNLALDVRSAAGMATTERPRLQVFPNPATDVLTVRGAATAGAALLRVLDITGREVALHRSKPEEDMRMDVSFLPAGAYLLHVEGQGTVRFIRR